MVSPLAPAVLTCLKGVSLSPKKAGSSRAWLSAGFRGGSYKWKQHRGRHLRCTCSHSTDRWVSRHKANRPCTLLSISQEAGCPCAFQSTVLKSFWFSSPTFFEQYISAQFLTSHPKARVSNMGRMFVRNRFPLNWETAPLGNYLNLLN